MRIAFISYEFPPDTGKGGIGTYVQQIATALAANGFDIHVFAGSPCRTATKKNNGYTVHWVECKDVADYRDKVLNSFTVQHQLVPFDCMESPEIGSNAWEIKKRFPQLRLIVRLHAPNFLVESLKKSCIPFLMKLRFVLGALRRLKWDLGYWKKYKKDEDTDYQFIKLADFITAPSESMKKWVVDHWQINPAKIVLIPNIFLPSKAWLQIPINKEITYKRIVFFGRLNVLKGLVVSTKVMKRILQEFPDWKFRVIGDDGMGPHAGLSMKTWMQKELKPVINQVEWMDGMSYEALPDAISPTEIVLLPSLFESFSYTCSEAMASGKAIIGSKNGGMADLLQQEKSGLLINPLSYREIHAALKKLIVKNELRHQISINGRERVLTDFNADKTTQLYIGYYRSLVGVLKSD